MSLIITCLLGGYKYYMVYCIVLVGACRMRNCIVESIWNL